MTQNRVIGLFRDELGYRYVGDWSVRSGNSNIEEGLLEDYLAKCNYSPEQISRAIYLLKTEAENPNRSLYENNKAVFIAEAVAVARQAEVIVLVIGGNEQTSREAWSLKHLGDRTSLDLLGRQDELVDALAATGKPVIALLFNGRPLSINHLAGKVPAILECWYLGQEGGRAVAEVLFGDVNPGGKLPISIPRSVGQLPVFYNHKPSARRGFLWDDARPLFPFGYGKSYTTFEIRNVRLAKSRIKRGERTMVSAAVVNTGKRAGSEVVQLYLRDCVSSVTRPVKELKAFQKVTLEPGETKTVQLAITPESLAFYDLKMKYTMEPGEFQVMVGNSSRDQDLQKLILTVTK